MSIDPARADAIQLAETLHDRLLELIPYPACLLQSDGGFQLTNPAFRNLLGYSFLDIPKLSLISISHRSDASMIASQLRQLARGTEVRFKCRCYNADGSLRWMDWHLVPAQFPLRIYAFAQDISVQRDTVNALKAERHSRAGIAATYERLQTVLDGMESAVYVADANTDELLFANRAFLRLLDKAPGGQIARPERGDYLLDPRGLSVEDLPRELFEGELQHPFSGRWYHVREDASRWVDGRMIRMGIATDITDRKNMETASREQEERVQQTARLITMGEMASTLAHELNQPLAAIANYCSGCVTRLQEGGWQRETILDAMKKASTQATRAGKIIRNIREFVRKSEPRRTATDVVKVIDDAIALAEIETRRHSVKLSTDMASDLAPVHADGVMIEQVILNLIRNALEAMTDIEPEERMLIVRARNENPGEIEIAVIDRGHGISEEGREKLFTPFYTTKTEGMGMGLNICRSIIEYHNGHLSVEPNPKGGTMFIFTLPTEPPSE